MVDELTVIADERTPSRHSGREVVRFSGLSVAGERDPAGIIDIRDRTANLMKERFGPWLYNWIKEHRGLKLAHWEGGLSWWWYGPTSERSPMRGDLITRTHQLLMLRELVKTGKWQRIIWYDTSPEMRRPVSQLVEAYGCTCTFIRRGKLSFRRRLLGAVLRCLYATLADLVRLFFLRLSFRNNDTKRCPKIILVTRFPRLWEIGSGNSRERMYGRLPGFLEEKGLPVAYAGLITESPLAWFRSLSKWRPIISENHIYPIHLAGSVRDILCVHLLLGFWLRYLFWRKEVKCGSAKFENLDISYLLRRELDFSVLDPDVASARLLARNLQKMLRKHPEVKCVMHPFEYQPIEKAVLAGVSQRKHVLVIGLQTGVFTSGQLGLLPNPEELCDRGAGGEIQSGRAPLPDILVTYGSLMSDLYRPLIGEERVLEVGALRYGQLATLVNAAERRSNSMPPRDRITVLVACSALYEEVWPMVRSAISVASRDPRLYLVFKFHYHLRMDAAVASMAQVEMPDRWHVREDSLYALIADADAVLTGASSVCYEALAIGRPTFVYLSPVRWNCSPAMETPEAFHFWHTEAELTYILSQTAYLAQMVREEDRQSALAKQLVLCADAEQLFLSKLGDLLIE